MYLGLFSAGILFSEYQILYLVHGCFVVFAAACALATIAAVLDGAPQGDERADGFHIRPTKRSPNFISAVPPRRHVR